MSFSIDKFVNLKAHELAGPMAEAIIADLHDAAASLEANFHAFGSEVVITVHTVPGRPWFKYHVAWMRGIGKSAEPWDKIFTFTLDTMLELRRTLVVDAGIQLGERMFNEIFQFDRRVLNDRDRRKPA